MAVESILPRLIDIYRQAGYETLTGNNPYHFNGYMDAPFTRFINQQGVSNAMFGLALQEIMFLEQFAFYMEPKNILVVGNAHGWSTLALALIFPKARVLGIDPGEEGNKLTNMIAAQNNISAVAAEGYSPQDVPDLCAKHLDGKLDLVLIDAVHEPQHMLDDFEACRAQSHDGTINFFHDLINWRLGEPFQKIRTAYGLEGYTLTRTPSGMGVAWKKLMNEKLRDYVRVFADDPALFRNYRHAIMVNIVDKLGPTMEKL